MVNLGISALIKWLLDTNVISETKRRKPNAEVSAWLSSLVNEQICTSTMNIAELRYGIHAAGDALLKIDIESWISNELAPWLNGRIFEATEPALLRWRILSRLREAKQEPAPAVDLLVAAIAQTNGLSIATRDTAPFVACSIPTLNPWTGERFNGA